MPAARNTPRANALKATTPAAFAKALDLDPKRVRRILRAKGIHVAKGDTFAPAEWIDVFAPKATRAPKAKA